MKRIFRGSACCVYVWLAYGRSFFKPGEVWPMIKGTYKRSWWRYLRVGDTYYWFGEHKTEGLAGNLAQVGVHCHSSKDLYNWKDEGIALSVVPV